MILTKADGLESNDAIPLTQRSITPEGYLQAPATLARSGVYTYRAGEFPSMVKAGMDPMTVVKLNRPDEEMFNPQVMSKAEQLPMIIEPHTTVNADTWKKLAVGDVAGAQRSGNLLNVDKLTVRDKSAVDLVQSGKKQLSLGYTFDLDPTPGVTPQGEEYHGIQRNLRLNHVVICSNARGGTQCQIADTEPQGEATMIIKIDGIPVEVGNDTAAAAITKVIEERDGLRVKPVAVTVKIGDTNQTLTGQDAIAAAFATQDATIAELRKQVLTPEQLATKINAAVTVRTAIIGDALAIDKDFKVEGKTNEAIQREVIEKVTAGDAVAKSVSEALLGQTKLEGADAVVLDSTFKAVVAAVRKAAATQTAQGGDATVAAAFAGVSAGDTAPGQKTKKLVGRDAFIARQNGTLTTK